MYLAEKIETQLPEWRERVRRLRGKSGDFKVCDVTVSQIYSGIRGVQIQVSDISFVDPQEGIRIRGYTIPELMQLLPKAPGSEMPLAGGLYYLLLCAAIPTPAEAELVEAEWRQRAAIPDYVYDILRMLPAGTHPMTLLSMGLTALQRESLFAKNYEVGVVREDHWRYYLEDSLNLTAKLPGLAAFVYNHCFQNGRMIPPNPDLDWSANFAHMIDRAADPDYLDLCRLFFFLHSDHEGGNVSAHATHLVCSALSDVYLSCAAGMNGLAGPLHGLANQECIKWLLGVQRHFRCVPSREELRGYLKSELAAGKLIPGYGHAVLRTTDPRFTAQYKFAGKFMEDDSLLQLVALVYDTLPEVLKEDGRVSNPWPNVDAINGALQYHFGVKQCNFYTVLFGVSRMLGLTAHVVWSRALMKPIERPKSLTTEMLEAMIASSG